MASSCVQYSNEALPTFRRGTPPRGPLSYRLRVDLGPRVVITGQSGAGKSILAMGLARKLGRRLLRVEEYLAAHPDRRLTVAEVSPQLTPLLVHEDEWILEVMLRFVPPAAWERATTVVWLDMSRGRLIWGILRRALWVLLIGKHSKTPINRRRVLADVRHIWRTHGNDRAAYEEFFATRLPAAIDVIRIRTVREREAMMPRRAKEEMKEDLRRSRS